MPLTGAQWNATLQAQGVMTVTNAGSHASQLVSDMTQYAQAATVAGRVVGNAFLLALVEAEHIQGWLEGSLGNTILSPAAYSMLVARGTAAYAIAQGI